jgi:hypothetical protein
MRIVIHLLTHGLAAALLAAGALALARWEAAGGSGSALWLACAAAIVIGVLLSHLVHEWGHYLGVLASRAGHTLKGRPSPLFFDFDYEGSSPSQYLWVSAGGPLGNILLTLALSAGLPTASLVHLSLWAAALGMLAYVVVLEGPISRAILAGGRPMDVVTRHFAQGLPLFRRAGVWALGVMGASFAAAASLQPL